MKKQAGRAPESDSLLQLAANYIEQGWQEGDADALEQLLAPNFVNHGTAGGGASRQEFVDGVRELYQGLPDFNAVIEDVLADSETGRVVIRWTGTGTHSGSMMDISPSGRRLTFRGIDIIRIEDDRIVERWAESNAAQVLIELAAAPGGMPQKKGASR